MAHMIALGLALAVALSGAPKASAPKKTQLKIEVKPVSAIIYVDGKRRGTGAKPITLPIEPGRHTIRIVHNRDEHQEVVVVKKGETTNWSWAFEDDRKAAQPAEPTPEPAPLKEPSQQKETPAPPKETSGPPKEPSDPGKEK
jgi:hypothetical protein